MSLDILKTKIGSLLENTPDEGWPEPLSRSDYLKCKKFPFHKAVVRGRISDGKIKLYNGEYYDYYQLHQDLSTFKSNEKLVNKLQVFLRTRKTYEHLEEHEKVKFDALHLNRDNIDIALQEMNEIHNKFQEEFEDKLGPIAQTEFVYFCALICPEEPPTSSAHLLYMMELFQKAITGKVDPRIVVSIAAGMAKTRTSSVKLPMFMFQLNNANLPIIITSGSKNFLGRMVARPLLNLIQKPVYERWFPHALIDKKRSGVEGIFADNGKAGSIVPLSIGSQWSGTRISCLILDDLYGSWGEARSEVVRRNVDQWFQSDVLSRLLPESLVIAVNTRFFSDDLAGQLIETANPESEYYSREFRFESFVIPLVATDPDDLIGRDKHELLWGNFYSEAHWASAFSKMSEEVISTLYFCKPFDETSQIVDPNTFKYYDLYPTRKDDEDFGYIHTILSVDTASTANERSDYTAITIWRIGNDRNFYLCETINTKLEFVDLVNLIREVNEEWDLDRILIEHSAAGLQLAQWFKAHRGKLPPIESINVNKNSKEFRLDACIDLFTDGRVLFPRHADWVDEVKGQLISFPYGKNDDIVDAISLFLNWANNKYNRFSRVYSLKI